MLINVYCLSLYFHTAKVSAIDFINVSKKLGFREILVISKILHFY